ncbi:MAG: Rne/Rng family ribonuclease [Gammaproteobacteria bacterium]|nr:Rne/Rng family ribonuclease [Gammaproteobacteria bacterium]
MLEEILIDVSVFETRVAILADGELRELHLERGGNYSLTGNLYNGRVARVVPGVQAAFVDIGFDRPGFLHVRDVHGFRTDGEPRDIRELVDAGQRLLVQVVKDPLNGKGARLTTNLAVAARHVVLLPLDSHVGVSSRIVEEVERERLKVLAESVRDELGQSYGCIVRTAGRMATKDQLRADLVALDGLWRRIVERRSSREYRGLVFEELPAPMRIVRDMAGPSVEVVKVNDAATFERLIDYVGRYLPEYADRIVHYDGRTPLFDLHDLEAAIERALEPRVSLPSGGHLVIEQTEAMTTIDVNSGAYVDSANLEDTAYRINLEAARAIPGELRLRNIGGIVVVDFIDMACGDHRDGVVDALVDAARGDPARFQASGFSELGLVEISRRRTRESLLHQMCEPCGRCAGHGRARSPQSACYDIFRAVERHDRNGADSSVSEYLVCAGQEVVDRLLGEDAVHLSAVARTVGRPIRLQVEPGYCADQFDVVTR